MALGDEEVISLPFRYVICGLACLPTSALFLCVLCALLLHYDKATETHCGVDNWLPSVSAAVSTFAPEKYIWRVLLGLHGGPRFIFAVANRNYLVSSPLQPLQNTAIFKTMCNVACFIHIFENIFLLLLTAISSVENHELHKICFGIFGASALVYMCLSTYLFSYSGRRRALSSNIGEKSFEYKCLFAGISFLSMILAGYLYYRHNMYCETGVYTLFALAEYFIILSNIAFHLTLYYDFQGKSLTIGASSSSFQYQLLPMHERRNREE
ncbi:tag-189 [Pristionchus pacificus]|uniref:Tag-189 protein n=1 Tax=Pristionchus pacificus TaxID=54126 RepID=A0A2A6BB64_PRIPA|nr:tag-189 [Pristionchus pacificus]|eukprot:PDM63125.1 tag-189 protein [Pristionchus pacificus]